MARVLLRPPIPESASAGELVSWNVPAGILEDGTYEVRAGSTAQGSTSWSAWNSLVISDTSEFIDGTPETAINTEFDPGVYDGFYGDLPSEDAQDLGPYAAPTTEDDYYYSEYDNGNLFAETEFTEYDKAGEKRNPIWVRVAPRLYFHPDEQAFPLSWRTFLNHSSVKWSHAAGCPDHKLKVPVDGNALGNGGYSHYSLDIDRSRCGAAWPGGPQVAHASHKWDSDDFGLRPFTADPGPGPDDKDDAEGMYLNLNNRYRDGAGPGETGGGLQGDEPVYYLFRSKKYIVYYFLYGNSRTKFGTTVPGTEHEGDWERIAIKLDSNNHPRRLEYFYHYEECSLPWRDVPRYGSSSQPRLVVARDSHGNYPVGFLNERVKSEMEGSTRPSGKVWNAAPNLENAETRNWFGFTGGWGQVGTSRGSSGPWGPNWQRTGEQAPTFMSERCGSDVD